MLKPPMSNAMTPEHIKQRTSEIVELSSDLETTLAPIDERAYLMFGHEDPVM